MSSNKLCCPCCAILIHSLLNKIERLKVASSTSTREQILLTQGGPPLQSPPGQCLLAYQLLEEAGYPRRYRKRLAAIDETSGPRKHIRPSFLDSANHIKLPDPVPRVVALILQLQIPRILSGTLLLQVFSCNTALQVQKP